MRSGFRPTGAARARATSPRVVRDFRRTRIQWALRRMRRRNELRDESSKMTIDEHILALRGTPLPPSLKLRRTGERGRPAVALANAGARRNGCVRAKSWLAAIAFTAIAGAAETLHNGI